MPINPLSDNCRAFRQDAAGLVTGVELRWHNLPATTYALVSAELINEAEAQGRTFARCWVEDANGQIVDADVRLLWEYTGKAEGMPNSASAGGTNRKPVEHIITNGYMPPSVGPLALAVVDASYDSGTGGIISDVVGGLGLPMGHHVSYDLVWKERGAVVVPPPVGDTLDEVRAGLVYIRDEVDALIARIPYRGAAG